MVKLALSSATSAAWLAAVAGAGAILVSPITPWMTTVEIVGGSACLIAVVVLVLGLTRG
jgi:hypothetical protein